MRVNVVQAARKSQGACGACGEEIKVGDGYRYIKFRYAGRRARHLTCAPFRPSDMTNAKYGAVYAAQESAEDELAACDSDALSDYQDILNTCAEAAREVAEEYEESASNMEDAFPNGSPKIDEIRESGEACEEFADQLESALDSIDEWDEEDARREIEEEHGDDEDDDFDLDDEVSQKLDEWKDNVKSEATSALGEFSL